jgi:hypothetical protein
MPMCSVIRNEKLSGSKKGQAWERRNPKAGLVFRCFLHGLKAGFACLQTQINPAKSRVLLFDVR